MRPAVKPYHTSNPKYSKAEYYALVKANRLGILEGAFLVDLNEAGAKKYMTISLMDSFERYKTGRGEHLHEALLPRDVNPRGLKMVFDIDIDTPSIASDQRDFLERFSIYLERLGINGREHPFTVLTYPSDEKTSFHIILNNGTHFADGPAMLAFLESRGFDFEENDCIDRKIYGSGGRSLRSIGGMHWYKPATMFHIQGIADLETTTFSQYTAALAQFVPHDSQLVEVGVVNPSVRPNLESGPYPEIIQRCVELARENGNEDAEFYARKMERGKLVFRIQNASCCFLGVDHADEQHDKTSVRVNVESGVAIFHCEICDAEVVRGVSDKISKFLAMSEFLKYLVLHKLDRPDFPIYGFGIYDLRADEWFQENRTLHPCPCRDCLKPDPIPECYCEFTNKNGNGPLIDLEFFNWLRDRSPSGTEPMMVAYLNLFLCFSEEESVFRYRSRNGLSCESVTTITGANSPLFGQFIHISWKPGKKDQPDVKVEKPFLPMYLKHANRLNISVLNTGKFRLGPGAPLNVSPPKDIDTNEAVAAWEATSPADQACIEWCWDTFIHMLCFNEPIANGHQVRCRQFLQRYALELMFEMHCLTKICVVLAGEQGGLGKSMFARTICCVVGKSNFYRPPDLGLFLKKEFSGDTNRHFIDGDEQKPLAGFIDHLKARVTGEDHFHDVKQGKNGVRKENRANIFISTNAKFLNMVIRSGRERRFWILRVPTVEQCESASLFNFTECGCSPVFDEDGVQMYCDHQSFTHPDFIQIYQQIILDGRWFMPFVGFLRKRYLNLRPHWKSSIQNSLFSTTATLKMQENVAGPVAKVMKMAVDRGYHWTPHLNPDKANDKPWIIPCDDLVRLGTTAALKWEQFVPIPTLFRWFKIEAENLSLGATAKNMSQSDFESDLEMFHMLCCNTVLTGLPKFCETVAFKQLNLQTAPTWEVITQATLTVRCFDMGTNVWRAAEVAAAPEARTILRASSSVAALNSSASLPGDEEYVPPADLGSRSNFAEEDRPRPVRKRQRDLQTLIRAVDAEDPVDPYMARIAMDLEENGDPLEEDDIDDDSGNDLDTRPKLANKYLRAVEEGSASADPSDELILLSDE